MCIGLEGVLGKIVLKLGLVIPENPLSFSDNFIYRWLSGREEDFNKYDKTVFQKQMTNPVPLISKKTIHILR